MYNKAIDTIELAIGVGELTILLLPAVIALVKIITNYVTILGKHKKLELKVNILEKSIDRVLCEYESTRPSDPPSKPWRNWENKDH